MNSESPSRFIDEETDEDSNGSLVGIGMLSFFALLVLIHVPAYLHFIADKFFNSKIILKTAENIGMGNVFKFIYSFTLAWLFEK